jgi:hypothetical protein
VQRLIVAGNGTHELHIRELEHLAQHGAGEESGMLDSDIARVLAGILIRHADLPQESVGRLTHDHGGEELAAEPSATTGGYIGLDDGNLQVWTGLGQAVGGRETAAASADDDNVALGVLVKIVEVATGHLAGDLALADRPEAEVLPLARHLLDGSLGLDSAGYRHTAGMRDSAHLGGDLGGLAGLRVDSDGSHCVGLVVVVVVVVV